MDGRNVPQRIEWHEGMLLAPQHFQLASARLDAVLAWHTLATAPFGWGVRKLALDAGLLAAGVFRVRMLDALMPDGTAVHFTADDPSHGSLELDLLPFAAQLESGTLDIHLVLPLSRSTRDRGVPSRFRSMAGVPVEDEVSEAVAADVPRLVPNLSLSAGAVPSGLHTHFRLATVYKDNELIKLGPALPPLMDVPKEGDLWGRVSELVAQLRAKAAFLAKQTAVPSSRAEDRLAYLEQKDRLRNLVSGLPQIEAVLRTASVHPYTLYLALCSLLAPLSLLKPGALPPVPPGYDHADLMTTLEPLIGSLNDALQEVSQEYREIKFEFKHAAFELLLLPEWVDKRLIVGMRGQSEKDLLAWMNGAIIGSQSAYASLRERRVLGAPRAPVEVAEELGVRTSAGYMLFAIPVSAGLTVPGQPLIISNSDSAAAQRPQELVLFVKG